MRRVPVSRVVRVLNAGAAGVQTELLQMMLKADQVKFEEVKEAGEDGQFDIHFKTPEGMHCPKRVFAKPKTVVCACLIFFFFPCN